MSPTTAFAVGVLFGLAGPWVVLALLDRWRARDTGAPERLTARAREVWGKGPDDAGA
jgi:hypothetical protein